MSIKNLFLILLLGTGQMALSQSEISSYFFKNSANASYLNPANTQDSRFSWNLPSFYYAHGSSGPGLFSLLKDNVLDLKNIEGKLKENNSSIYALQGAMGSLHYRHNNFSFQVGHNMKSYLKFDYNNNLFSMLLEGNAQYIGETVQVGPYAKLDYYNEFYLGSSITFQNLSIGAKIKKLNGYVNASTPVNEFSIYTSDEIYQLSFNTDYQINTNLYADSLDWRQITSTAWNNIFGNGGWAFDFGIRADIQDKVSISASLIDMGYIKYDNNARKITTKGSFTFEGFDVMELITDSLDVIDLDSLSDIVQIENIEESYRSALPVQFYLGLQYYVSDKWEVNGLFYNAYAIGKSFPSVTIMGKYKPSEYFHTSLAYTWNPFAHVNIGWSAEAHLKWFHLFLSMDNIVDLFRPVGGNYFNVRTGMQIDFMR